MCDGYESDTAQVGQLVAEKVAGVVFDLVELADRQVGVGDDGGFDGESVTGPAHSEFVDVGDAGQ